MKREQFISHLVKRGGMLLQQEAGWTITWDTKNIPSQRHRTLHGLWTLWKSWVENVTFDRKLVHIVLRYYKSTSPKEVHDIESWLQRRVARLPESLQNEVDFEMSYAFSKCLPHHWGTCADDAILDAAIVPSNLPLREKIAIAIAEDAKNALRTAIPPSRHIIDANGQARL